MEEIINKVAASNLIQIDLEEFYPTGERVVYDLKDNLYEGLLLREKDFRAFLKTHAWENYANKHIAITCSTDAIVPTWAYMLLATHLQPFAATIIFGNLADLEKELFRQVIEKIDIQKYENAKVVVKGCSKNEVPTSAYIELSRLLRPHVASLMFGEPCSTVPIYKKSR
jgi:hypothetical protein